MSFRLPLRPVAFSALLLSAAVAVAWIQPDSAAAPTAWTSGAEDDLEEIMEGMDKNFEAVYASIEKKEAAPALELMSKMQIACISAKTLTPPKLRTIEEKDKAAFVTGYRKQMMTLLKGWADLEIALLDGDFDKAKKLAEEMDGMKKSSHDVYKKMPRKGGAGGEKQKEG